MTFVFKQHATGASVRRNDNKSGNGSIPDNEVSYATSKKNTVRPQLSKTMPQPNEVRSSSFGDPAKADTHKVAQLRAEIERLKQRNVLLLSNQQTKVSELAADDRWRRQCRHFAQTRIWSLCKFIQTERQLDDMTDPASIGNITTKHFYQNKDREQALAFWNTYKRDIRDGIKTKRANVMEAITKELSSKSRYRVVGI